jgi:hypothetical protein
MYARIARFEGGDVASIDQQVADMKAQIDATRASGLPADAPAELKTLSETVSRFVEPWTGRPERPSASASARRRRRCVAPTRR